MTGEGTRNYSLVVDVEEMISRPHSMMEVWEAQCIYRVPEWLMGATNNIKAYQPQLVSLGPIHHFDRHLQPMEEHKRRSLVQLIRRSRKPLQDFLRAINDVAEQLMNAYGGMDLNMDQQRFVEVMLTDGCFLLEMMTVSYPDYELHDPIFGVHGRRYTWPFIQSDMLKIENQLPLLVLKKIIGVMDPDVISDKEINILVLNFLGWEHVDDTIVNVLGLHPLELYHRSLIYRNGASESYRDEDKFEFMPSALEIHEAGIKFSPNESRNLLDIQFEHGVLSMPRLTVDDSTESLYLNLMAFERLHTGSGYLVMAYVIFMDNIIGSAKDVAILTSNDVVRNMLGCDEEAAKLFNGTLSRGQMLGPCSNLHKVQRDVKAYCSTPWHKWRATLIRTHFENPWAFISLAAAIILLIATVLQTAYTIKQSNS